MTAVSPPLFGIWQRGLSLGPWLLFIACIVGAAAFLHHLSKLNWLEVALLFGIGGGGAVGYAAWAASNDWQGLIRKPQKGWRVSLDGSALMVQAAHLKTVIPLRRISSAKIVVDGSWDTLNGVEDQCLVLRIKGAPQISVPGSSEGFDEMQKALRALIPVGFKELGVA